MANETRYIHIAVNYPSNPLINIRIDVDRPVDEYGTNPILPSNTYAGASNGHWQDLVFAINGGAKGLAINNISLLADFNNYVNYTSVGDVLDNTSKFAYFDNIVVNASSTPLFTARTGLEAIILYASSNTNAALRLVDYNSAGVTGVTEANLKEVNAAIDSADPAPTTLSQIQAEVNKALKTLAAPSYSINDFNLYPNPTSDSVTVDLQNFQNVKVQVFDINGHQVYESPILKSKQLIINVKQILAKGVYFVKVTDGNSSQTKKIILK